MDNPVKLFGTVVTVLLLGLLTAGHSQASIDFQNKWGGSFQIPGFYPSEVDFSPNGDIFIYGSGRIIRLDENREPVASWGTGSDLGDIAVDDDGNVYVTDNYPSQVKKYSNTGTLIDTWIPSGDGTVDGIAFESGSIYLMRGSSVERRSPTGTVLDEWGFDTDDNYPPPVIAGDDDGHVFVTATHLTGQTATKSILKFGPSGTLLSTWTTPAKVLFGQYPHGGGPYVAGIEGYRGVAPAADGGAYVTFWGSDKTVTKLSPAGVEEGGWTTPAAGADKLSVGPDGKFWMNLSNVFNELGEFDSDGTVIKRWRPIDLPKYVSGDLGEGKFSQIGDLSVGPDGKVFALDPSNFRIQRFSDAGNFEAMVDEYLDIFGQTRMAATDNGYALFNSFRSQMVSYTADGDEISRFPVNFAGREIRDAVSTGDGGFLLLVSNFRAEPPTAVTRVDSTGQRIGIWYPDRGGDQIALKPGGNGLVLSASAVSEYTTDGSPVGCWGIDVPRTPSGYNPSGYGVDIATNDRGRVFVLTGGNDPEVQEYLSGGRMTDRTGISAVGDDGSAVVMGEIETAPGDSLYLAGSTEVDRFRWTPPTARARPALECDPAARFGFESISFHAKRRWARAFLNVPEAGRIAVAGGNNLKSVGRRVATGGLYSLAVVPKPRYMKPVRRKAQRKIRLKMRFRYTPAGGSAQEIIRRFTFVRSLRHPHR